MNSASFLSGHCTHWDDGMIVAPLGVGFTLDGQGKREGRIMRDTGSFTQYLVKDSSL